MRVVVIMMLTMTTVFGKETLNEGDKGKNLLPKVAKVWASILGPHIVHLAINIRIVFSVIFVVRYSR